MSVCFTQSCPTCGRRIQIRASLLGCTVGCQHCHAVFEAQEDFVGAASRQEAAGELHPDPLMERVEQALSRAKQETVVS
jgi:pyruvate-formate lyase-activating enzyme